MDRDVEDLLREGMERFTTDVAAPAGMVRLAAQRRHRRIALRSGAGLVAALAAAAVALVAVVVPGGSAGGSDVLAAYVLKRVDGALNAAEPGDIAQMTVVSSGVGGLGFALCDGIRRGRQLLLALMRFLRGNRRNEQGR